MIDLNLFTSEGQVPVVRVNLLLPFDGSHPSSLKNIGFTALEVWERGNLTVLVPVIRIWRFVHWSSRKGSPKLFEFSFLDFHDWCSKRLFQQVSVGCDFGCLLCRVVVRVPKVCRKITGWEWFSSLITTVCRLPLETQIYTVSLVRLPYFRWFILNTFFL